MNEPTGGEAAEGRRRAALLAPEAVTLWSVAGGVVFYTLGQISSFYKLVGLGVRSLHADAQWQDRVFEGGLCAINLTLNALTNPQRLHLPWLAALAALLIALRARRSAARRPRLRLGVTAAAFVLALTLVLLMGIAWGKLQADFVRQSPPAGDHFVFAAEAAARLPPALLRENEQRTLRLINAAAESYLVASGDFALTWRFGTKDVLVFESRTVR